MNSADLPAEFRDESSMGAGELGGDQEAPPPREQSKLAKLCEQTSSVLASVLPAPFGGHKRSILCQFFGQVPLMTSAAGGKKSLSSKPISINTKEQPDSVAVIHPLNDQMVQQQQQPIMLMRPMKHPIELLLEHQRQQAQMAARIQLQQQSAQPQQDLKGSASVLDYSYQQRLEAPLSMQLPDREQQSKNKKKSNKGQQERFSQQIKASSASPAMLSTSGWRIFDNLPEQTQQQNYTTTTTAGTSHYQTSSTTMLPSATSTTSKAITLEGAYNNRTTLDTRPTNQSSAVGGGQQTSTAMTSNAASAPPPLSSTSPSTSPKAAATISIQQKLNLSREKLGAAQLLVLGRPPNYLASHGQQQQQPTEKELTVAAKRSEPAAKSSPTTRKPLEQQRGLRTIEVVAQNSTTIDEPAAAAAASERIPANANQKSSSSSSGSSNQAQKREELVIASINNLTRIAFGNQLRDTFKVINKLIDQQAGLFAAPSTAASKSKSQSADLLMTSESQNVAKKTTADFQTADSKKNKTTKSREKEILPSSSSAAAAAAANLKVSTQNSKRTNKRVTPSAIPSAKKQASEWSSPSSTVKGDDKASRATILNAASERKSTISSSLESRRLSTAVGTHTVSRSLSLDSFRRTTKPLAPFESSWSTTLVADDLVRRDRSGRNSNNNNNKQATKSELEPPIKSSGGAHANQLVNTVVTQYPWLIPDQERSTADFFGDYNKWSAATTPKKQQQPPTGMASKRWTPKTTTTTAAVAAGFGRENVVAATKNKQPLVLNRLEQNRSSAGEKVDSLTTLKMSLGQPKSTRPSSTTSTAAATTTTASTYSQGGIQSRWIPTVGLLSRSKTSDESHLRPLTTTTTTTLGGSTTPMPAQLQTTAENDEVHSSSKESTSKVSQPPAPTQSDLMEARASDSISKFTTTQWNESAANEMMATTRRFLQQPLPQIAQTGEYFNAETISSWPEKYQTMLESSLRSSTVGLSSVGLETTRRNGETIYPATEQETPSASSAPTTKPAAAIELISRHRYDTTVAVDQQQQAADRLTTRRMDFDPTSFTVLPANHKLSTTDDAPLTSGLVSSSTETQQQRKATTMPQLEIVELPTATMGAKQTNQSNSPLRPPYSSEPSTGLQESGVYDLSKNSSAPDYNLASRAIYEELLKLPATTRNFVGPHHSSVASHQALNLSALRLLGQGLFATLGSADTARSSMNKSLISPPVEQSMGGGGQFKLAGADSPETLNNSDRLLEMLGAQQNSTAASMFPMSQYELPLNGTHPQAEIGDGRDLSASKEASNKSDSSSSKWLLGRASNLLNDLKQLEQRRAAALLAAIRYQVPGPLVRPWDLNSDLQHQQQQRVSDRLDSGAAAESEMSGRSEEDYLGASLWMAKASDAIRWALMKQRVVPPNELEARLSGRKRFAQEKTDETERRSDRSVADDDTENTFILMDGQKNKTKTKQDAEYVLVSGNSSSSSSDDDSSSSWSPLSKIILTQASSSNKGHTTHIDKENDGFELKTATGRQDEKSTPQQQYPKYIHFSDYRTSWSPKPAADKSRPKFIAGQLSSSSAAIAARLRNSTTMNNPQREAMLARSASVKIEGAKQLDTEASEKNSPRADFDCSDKAAGFHPDANTNCQVSF